jgi:hypothetical protein
VIGSRLTAQRIVGLFLLGSSWITGCNSDREVTGPEPSGIPPELVASAIRLRVDLKGGTVSVSQRSASQQSTAGAEQKPSFALLGRNEVSAAAGTMTRSAIGQFVPNRVRVTFPLTLTSNLTTVDLVPSTFPPSPVNQVVAFPFSTQPAGLFGLKVRASTDWDGPPYNFFNDPVDIGLTPPGDWFRWEPFGSTIVPNAPVSRTVGFDVDPSVTDFTVYVAVAADVRERPTPVNQAPTIDPISNPAAILEDAGQQTINLTGITAGAGEAQALTVTATSSNPGLIPNPTVSYASPANTGSLSYTPVANQSGSATITVIVQDDGGTTNGGINTSSRSFTATVTPVNDPPTLDPIADPAPITLNAGQQTINLTGISAGPGETQALAVTATSGNTALIPDPTVSYTSPASTGSLSYTAVTDQSGSAILSVSVRDAGVDGIPGNGDDGSLTRSFTVQVTSAQPDFGFTPANLSLQAGTTKPMEVTLGHPALHDTNFLLSVSPETFVSISVPVVTVPAGQSSSSPFSVTALGSAPPGTAVITATLGTATATSTVTIEAAPVQLP